MPSEPTDYPASPERKSVASSSVPPGATVEICGGCHLPLTRRGPQGECLRCWMQFALLPVNEPVSGADPEPLFTRPGTIRYGHFEVAVGADGFPVELGSGAMAVTYRALDTVLHSQVALKVIDKKVAVHPAARARFLREARAAAKLHHPNVATVSNYGEQDGECFYVMELVDGETLEARVRREGPFPIALVLEVGVQVARALAAAEAAGVVHRDLKPSNVMLTTRQGETGGSDALVVKVIDWGLAKAVAAESALGMDHTHGGFVGTPAFASPEQFIGSTDARVDTRTDIYSLGVTLWYLLAGQTPFAGRSLEEIQARQTNEPLPLGQLAGARLPTRVVTLLKSMLAVDPAGRPQSARELLAALRLCQEQYPPTTGPKHRWMARRWIISLFALLAALLAAGAQGWWHHASAPPASTADSIAVLPFDNLSPSKDDAFFAVGVQDEISADLSRIKELKVIGSDSTRAYPLKDRDFAKIARDLGVSHLLEGSLKREADRVQVNVRLIDVRDPAHSWTQRYDRRLADVFAMQGEITRAIADRLSIRLSEIQKSAINEPPTSDLAAYDLYLRAREIPHVVTTTGMETIYANGRRAIQLLEEAIARDPNFLLAYCELARRHDELFFNRMRGSLEELSVDHRGLAESALAKAARLRPNSGAVHLGQAIHALQVNRDVEQADFEIQLALQSLPNNAQVETIAGRVARRQDRWEEALHRFERAASLEPRDVELRNILASTYRYLRRYDDYDRTMASVIALTPSGELLNLPLERALGSVERSADVAAYRNAFDAQVGAHQLDETSAAEAELNLALWTRDDAALTAALSKHPQIQRFGVSWILPRSWFEAIRDRMRGDRNAAARSFANARGELEKRISSQAGDGKLLSALAIVDAGLGHNEDAVREAQLACELTSYKQSNLDAPTMRCNLAVVYGWTGANDLAFAELDKLVGRPTGQNVLYQLTYGDLRLNPLWDPLRNDPRFAVLVERLAPSSPH